MLPPRRSSGSVVKPSSAGLPFERDEVVAKVDIDAFVGHALQAQQPFGAPEGIGHDRQRGGRELQITDDQRVHTDRGHDCRTRDTAQPHLWRLAGVQSQALRHAVDHGRTRGTRIQYQPEGAFAIKIDGHPHAADTIAVGGRHIARLGRLNQYLGQFISAGRLRQRHLRKGRCTGAQRDQ